MASKSKRRSKKRSAAHLLKGVRRRLDRGDFKQALKEVRVCFRTDPTEECRCFLEHTYIGRAQQLLQNGLAEDARRILQELLDLGVTEPAVEAGLPELLLSVGLFDRLPQGHEALSDEDRDRLRLKAADQAVLRPQHTPESMPELRDEAQRVRAALQAVEDEDESAALEHLGDIARQSPLADWKYFVRGLIAYYGREKGDLTANWDRLDPDRAAARIAAPLRVMAGVASPGQDAGVRLKLGRLEKQATDQTVLSQLIRLRQAAADRDWRKVFSTLRAVRGEVRRLDADVHRRMISCLCGDLVNEGLVDQLHRFCQIADPPAIDPRWNRAKAVACERSDSDSQNEAEKHWLNYLEDLQDLPALSSSQRHLAQAMVWLRLAKFYATDASHLRNCDCPYDHGPEIEEAEEEAQNAFRWCFSLAPDYAPAYAAAAEVHLEADRREEAIGVYRQLLVHVPDDLAALLFLGKYYIAHDQPNEAREYVERARQLKPLDPQLQELMSSVHVRAARDLARSQEYDAAREELAAADRLQPSRANSYHMLARRAVLETKAGCTSAARRFLEQAQDQLVEPTALWLVMAIQAPRYGLPKEEGWLYEKRWQAALKRRCRSETAGLMCEMLLAHWKMPKPYPQLRAHVPQLLKYVRRCSRVKWDPEDLRRVCEFLMEMDELKLAAKYAKKGVRNWPQQGYFHYLMGLQEMANGPFGCNRSLAEDYFEKAIELAAKSGDPRDEPYVELAKQGLSTVRNVPDFPEVDEEGEYDNDFDEAEAEFYRHIAGRADGHRGVPSLEELKDVIQGICDRFGLDPEELLDEIAARQRKKSRRKRTKK